MRNRRGITLTSNVEKLFERVINNRLVKILEFSEGHCRPVIHPEKFDK